MEEDRSTWRITDYDVSDLDQTLVMFLFDAFEKFKIKYCPHPPWVEEQSWWNLFFEVYDGLRAYLHKSKYYNWERNATYVPVTNEWLSESSLNELFYSTKDTRPSDEATFDHRNATLEREAAARAGMRKLGEVIPYLWGSWTEDNLWIDGKLYDPMVEEAERRYDEWQFQQIVENFDE